MKTPIFAIALALVAIVGFAQEPSPLGGHIETTIVAPTGWNDDTSYQDLMTELKLSADLSAPIGALYGELFFTADNLAGSVDGAQRLSIRPGEMYLSLYRDRLDMTLGNQMIVWGSVDALSPTDIINPIDLSDLTNLAATDPEDVRIPVNALRVNLYPVDSVRLEGVFLPLFTAAGTPDITAYLPSELAGIAISFETPGTELTSFEAGGRASLYLRGIDVFLSYLYTWDDIPDIQSVGVAQQDIADGIRFGSPTSLGFAHNRTHVIGTGFAWPVSGLDLRGEAAYYLTEDTDGSDIYVKNPYLSYTLQAGYKVFGRLQANVIFSQRIITNFRAISDYTYSIDPTDPASWNQTDTYYQEAYAVNFGPLLSNQRAQFMSSIMLILQQSFLDEYLNASLAGLYNVPADHDDSDGSTSYGDFAIMPMVEYQIADSFNVSVGANLFFSFMENSSGKIVRDQYSTFGLVDDKDSFFLRARFSF